MSHTTNPDAFPHPAFTTACVEADGMTLRDYFAAKALATLFCTWPRLDVDDSTKEAREIAKLSYQVADAMLAEREKGEVPK